MDKTAVSAGEVTEAPRRRRGYADAAEHSASAGKASADVRNAVSLKSRGAAWSLVLPFRNLSICGADRGAAPARRDGEDASGSRAYPFGGDQDPRVSPLPVRICPEQIPACWHMDRRDTAERLRMIHLTRHYECPASRGWLA